MRQFGEGLQERKKSLESGVDQERASLVRVQPAERTPKATSFYSELSEGGSIVPCLL